MIKIGIDVMSGEAPLSVLLEGCFRSLEHYKNLKLFFIGDEDKIKSHIQLGSQAQNFRRIEILPCNYSIGMGEDPAVIRTKPDSSIMIGVQALRKGSIDALFSPGNTGAALAASLLEVGRIRGVKRPAIASPLPTDLNRKTAIFIDAGANVDCTSEYLLQFAIMGYVYSKKILLLENPSIGILNIGQEERKGNKLTKESFGLLSKLPYNFVGNVEPADFFKHKCDVVVCDGFAGNIFLKSAEATAAQITGIMRSQIKLNRWRQVGAFLMRKMLRGIREEMNASNFGAAPLLGIAKPVLIGHGSSNDVSVFNAIGTAILHVKNSLVESLEEEIAKIQKLMN